MGYICFLKFSTRRATATRSRFTFYVKCFHATRSLRQFMKWRNRFCLSYSIERGLRQAKRSGYTYSMPPTSIKLKEGTHFRVKFCSSFGQFGSSLFWIGESGNMNSVSESRSLHVHSRKILISKFQIPKSKRRRNRKDSYIEARAWNLYHPNNDLDLEPIQASTF